ncbi:MAG: prepilin-type N-terminal cleavage/methylation domain-containing protein [Chromatiales bacterium]|nr:prepilin-type N-terminal cleavage/methylation domain-containing protein [Chromatiales bacterium]
MRRSYEGSSQRGFTLIEMVIVITMLGALLALGGVFIVQPFEAYEDVARRARLVDVAETAMMRMTRETRMALPNSVRITSSSSDPRHALEFLATATGGRYRQQVDDTGAGDPLDRTLAADSFDVLGGLQGAVAVGSQLVIYNTGDLGLDAYKGDNSAPITGVGAASLSFAKGSAPAFPADSPQARFYVVTGPVSFVCDADSGTLRRYAGYPIQATQPVSDAALGGAGALLADNVSNCGTAFTYNDGGGSRNGLVTFRLTITEDGERVSLLQQAHVLNIP